MPDSTTKTSGVEGARNYEDFAKQSRVPKTELGKNEFLQLLVAQLTNQDPSSPQDNTAFVAQLAQFSALEQMQLMNSHAQSTQAFSLLGSYGYAEVTPATGGDPVPVMGQIRACSINGGIAYLVIEDADGNKTTVPMASLTDVMDKDTYQFVLEEARKKAEEAKKPADTDPKDTGGT